jgi:hypothetical protein
MDCSNYKGYFKDGGLIYLVDNLLNNDVSLFNL